MMSSSFVRCVLVGLGAVGMVGLVAGCGGGSSPSDNFSLRMVDSGAGSRSIAGGDGLVSARAGSQGPPANAVALRVTVEEIRAIPVEGPPVRLALAEATVIDVLNLPASFTVLEQDLPPGDYVKLELIVASAELELDDTTVLPVDVPSGTQTGLKLPVQYTIDDGYNTVLALDWNTGNSIHCTGNGQWKLRPTALTVTEITQVETVDNVTVVCTDIAPAQATQGATEVGMLQLDFTVDDNFATIEGLGVSLTATSTGAAADVDNVDVWLDGGDGVFNPGDPGTDDAPIGTAAFGGSPTTVDITDQTFNNPDTLTLWVSFDIAAGATTGKAVGASVTVVTSPDNVLGLPCSSSDVLIQ